MSDIWINQSKLINKKTGEEIRVINVHTSYDIPIFDAEGGYDYDLGADSYSIVKTDSGVLRDPEFDWGIYDWVDTDKSICSDDLEKLKFIATTTHNGNEEIIIEDIIANFDVWLERFNDKSI